MKVGKTELHYGHIEPRIVVVDVRNEVVAIGRDETELEIELCKQCYCNARFTESEAGGHGKAEDNHRACERYSNRLKELGAEVPTIEDALSTGKFNGIGAQ